MKRQYNQIQSLRRQGMADAHVLMLKGILEYGATAEQIERLILAVTKYSPKAVAGVKKMISAI